MRQPAPVARLLRSRRGGVLGYLRQIRGEGHADAVRRLLARGAAINGSGPEPPLASAAPSSNGQRERPSSYRLHANEHLAAAIRRAAREQLDDAIEQLTSAIDDDPVTAVHEARKCVKKERALLRLVHDSFAPAAYRRENSSLRDAGRRLSAERDADVLVETLDELAEHCAARLPASTFAQVRAVLVADQARARDAAAADRSPVRAIVAELRDARARIDDWPLVGDEFVLIEGGLGRAYARGVERFERVLATPSVENLHEWRKRVKDLWYHLRLVKPMWPEVLGEQVKQAAELADLLGDDHDLAVLGERLAEPLVARRVVADLRPLRDLIGRRRLELQARARFLGMRLYADRPRAYPRRMGRLWEAWRAETAQAPPVWS